MGRTLRNALVMLAVIAAEPCLPGESADEKTIHWAGVGGITDPEPRRRSIDILPKIARKSKIGGSLVLQVIVRRDGSVEVERLLGCRVWKFGKKPNPKLESHCSDLFETARQSVEDWEYHSALLDGRPIDSRYAVDVFYAKRATLMPHDIWTAAEREGLLPPEAHAENADDDRQIQRAPAALPPEDSWHELRTPHFTVYSNRAERARSLARHLATLRAVLAKLYGTESLRSARPTKIYLFRDRDSFAPYTVGPSVGAYFLRTLQGNFLVVPLHGGFTEKLYHEALHAFLADNMPHVPLWLNEGIAELYSTFRIKNGQAQIGNAIFHHTRLLRKEGLMPIEELFAVDRDSDEYDESTRRGIFYAQSWALTHYLMVAKPELTRGLTQFIDRLGRGEALETAFAESFPVSPDELTGQLERYVHGNRYPWLNFELEELEVDAKSAERELSRAETLAHLGHLLIYADSEIPEGAAGHLDEALRLEPELAVAHVARGILQTRQEDSEAAEVSFREAMRIDGSNGTAALMLGRLLLETSEDDERSEEAAELLRRAIELNPGHSDGYRLLGHALVSRGSCDEGPQMLKKAWQMLPSDLATAGAFAVALHECGETENARYIFDTVLSPHAHADLVGTVGAALGD